MLDSFCSTLMSASWELGGGRGETGVGRYGQSCCQSLIQVKKHKGSGDRRIFMAFLYSHTVGEHCTTRLLPSPVSDQKVIKAEVPKLNARLQFGMVSTAVATAVEASAVIFSLVEAVHGQKA